jgi:hypothetical protein
MSTAEPSGAMEIAPIEDTSLLAFYRDMNLPERRTFWACAAGWALDGMDFIGRVHGSSLPSQESFP